MIRKRIEKLIRESLEIKDIEIKIERPSNKEYGDYSSNIAMVLSKILNEHPLKIAERIRSKIEDKSPKIFEKIVVEKPGFINFYLKKEYLQDKLKEILKKKEKFFKLNIGKGKKVQVEFISANPTGPLTIGNGRGGFLGDVLSNILEEVGYKVTREYFINDKGEQIKKLGFSVLNPKKGVYKGEYIEEIRKKLKKDLKKMSLEKAGERAGKIILNEMIKPSIKRMGIKFDKWFSESSLYKSKLVDKVIKILKDRKLVYEKNKALWFRSKKFGDDKDRVLIKKNKEHTYFLSDIAYHWDKFKIRKFDKVIDIWGADHFGYVKRVIAAKKALKIKGELKIIITQLVKLFKNGKEIRMSKRKGTFITLDELIKEVGVDVSRFLFLSRSPDTHLDFDLDLAKEESKKNPVYYIQYAYARIKNILKKSKYKDSEIFKADFRLLNHKYEIELIKQLLRFNEVIEDIVYDYQVHRLCYYTLELVSIFHKFYETCRVISEDKKITLSRLALVKSTEIILKKSLDIMGISTPSRM